MVAPGISRISGALFLNSSFHSHQLAQVQSGFRLGNNIKSVEADQLDQGPGKTLVSDDPIDCKTSDWVLEQRFAQTRLQPQACTMLIFGIALRLWAFTLRFQSG